MIYIEKMIEKDKFLCEGYICVKEGEYYGVKNTNGQWVVNPIYDEIMYMEEDLIARNNRWHTHAARSKM